MGLAEPYGIEIITSMAVADTINISVSSREMGMPSSNTIPGFLGSADSTLLGRIRRKVPTNHATRRYPSSRTPSQPSTLNPHLVLIFSTTAGESAAPLAHPQASWAPLRVSVVVMPYMFSAMFPLKPHTNLEFGSPFAVLIRLISI